MLQPTLHSHDGPPARPRARRLPVGAEPLADGGTHFRVWAPRRTRVEAVLQRADGREIAAHALAAEGNGYFSGRTTAGIGSLYRYRLDGAAAYPDPASRFQPQGPHGPSEVVDPASFTWSDADWQGVPLRGQVIYELHVGTFTREGTWRAAIARLPHLVELGVTVVELMPVADFCGRFNWGYDGVNLFAPTRAYGRPDDMRAFIDAAHRAGIAVILDVVYNHFGPDGAYHREFSPDYFTDRYENEWGEPINFDGPDAAPVREFFVANARYWVEEFHIDGLRLDATQQIFDASPVNVMVEITRAVREAARGRATLVVSENEPQHTRLVRPVAQNGYGMDALWNDDFHHSARVALTGRNEAYYTDYLGTPQELVSAVKWGYLYQGQRYKWQGKRRGTPAFGLEPMAFINYIQNHDQVANSGLGVRCHFLGSRGRLRALTALTLLAPGTPMLFMGQEFAASSPFNFFADHGPELAAAVRSGRADFMRQFPSMDTPEMAALLPDPAAPSTFERCKLDWDEAGRGWHAQALAMHKDLLRLRREDAAFASQRRVEGAVLAPEAFVLRFFDGGGDRLLLVNLGPDLRLYPSPEPLLAPPEGQRWTPLWSSEDPRYGGGGTPPAETAQGWHVAGHSALVMHPVEDE